MKLVHLLTLRLSLIKAIVFALWGVLFYFAIIDEINDETDDALEDYAEVIMTKWLAGEDIPDMSNGSNNQYYMENVSQQFADTHPHIVYADRDVYIEQKHEHEPARTISYIFMDDNGQYHCLTVFTPTIDKEDLKQAVVVWLVVLIGGLLLCMAVVNWHTLRHGMQPLHALLRWLEHYSIGASATMPQVKANVTEFRRLNDTVADTIRRSEESYEQQKEFISNASHEIQTPIAVAQNRLEMLLEDETLGEHAMGEVIKVLHALKGLARTNRSLLLLSKIDNGQFADTVMVDMGMLAESLLPEIASAYDHLGVSVHVNTEGVAQIKMNEALARTLMTNLLKNAFLHNVEGGQIDMRVTKNSITLANTGKNEALDVTRIFERFYHSPEKTSSTGLGLSIVKAVCCIYGIDIEYRFAAGMHFFSLSLPGKN